MKPKPETEAQPKLKPSQINLDDTRCLQENSVDIQNLKACNQDVFAKLTEALTALQTRAYVLGYHRGLRDAKAEQEKEKPE